MHFLVKGIVGKMLILTFDESYASKEFNIHNSHNRVALGIAKRCVFSTAPPDAEWPKAVFECPGQLKCAEILSFIRIYAIPSLAGMPGRVYSLWVATSQLVSRLLYEGEVPVSWVANRLSQDVCAFLVSFEVGQVFSPRIRSLMMFSRAYSGPATVVRISTSSFTSARTSHHIRPLRPIGCSRSSGSTKRS